LPYDAEVQYLSSNGSQWVDTGFAPTFPSNLEYKARVLFPNTTNRIIMGLQGGMYFGVVNGKLQPGLGGTSTVNASVSANTEHDFDIVYHLTQPTTQFQSQIDWSMDSLSGTTASELYNFKPADAPVWIFTANDASGLRGASRVYSFQILVNGTAVRDYIPVRVGSGSSAVGYLFDRVSGTLFGNAGTGNFAIGPDK
jgi:hypothetical protein